jgi:hypothetical protein
VHMYNSRNNFIGHLTNSMFSVMGVCPSGGSWLGVMLSELRSLCVSHYFMLQGQLLGGALSGR